MEVTTFAPVFSNPFGVAVDSRHNIFVSEMGAHRISRMSATGTSEVFAGSGAAKYLDGPGTAAAFSQPHGLAIDQEDNLIVADYGNDRIRMVSREGEVTTIGEGATFVRPTGVAVDGDNCIYVVEHGAHRVSKISKGGLVRVVAGSGFSASIDGLGCQASFSSPVAIAVDMHGQLLVSDGFNFGAHKLRQVAEDGVVSTVAGGLSAGFADGQGTCAAFHQIWGIAADAEGSRFVSDTFNNSVRMVSSSGEVSTVAGNGTAASGDGWGCRASFASPQGIAVSPDGALIVVESSGRVRRVDARLRPAGFAKGLPASTLAAEMATYLEDTAEADVEFEVLSGEARGELVTITAHRQILIARSAYFRTMLRSSFQEGQRGSTIKIGDTNEHAFRAILRYLYTDELRFDDSDLVDVFRKAQEIDLVQVTAYCERQIRRRLCPANAIDFLVRAEASRLQQLRRACFDFVSANFKAIREEAGETVAQLMNNPRLQHEVLMAVTAC